MLESKKRTGSGTHSYKWKIRPTPWKLALNWITKSRDKAVSPFSNRGFVLAFIMLAVIIIGLSTWSDQSNDSFHSYTTSNPPHYVKPTVCTYYAPQLESYENYTCGEVAGDDPTTPISSFSAASGNLAEFNTAGNVAWKASASCGAFSGHGSTCMQLTATVAPPPLAVQFQLTTTVKTTGATLVPTSFSAVYKRVTAISNNNTFQFDVTGGHAQTGTYTVTTSATTTLTFYGVAPTVVCVACSTISYTGYSEVLTLGPGLTSSPVTVSWTGSNLNYLGAMAESVNPIGDLSPVVARELEQTLFWQPINNVTVTNGCAFMQCSWGWFLTTNATVWATNNPTWTPYNDPSVALFVEIHLFKGVFNFYPVTLYIQQKPGETLQQEDATNLPFNTGGQPLCSGGGSAFMCNSNMVMKNLGSTPAMVNYLLNYTGAGGGSGVATTCPFAIAQGSTGCSSLIEEQANPAIITFASNTNLPALPITGQTYYQGFWMGASQLGSPMRYCFDNGDGNANFACNQAVPFKQYYTIPGCTGSSMETDYCLPTGCLVGANGNCVSTTTDSGGFFGSALRSFGGIGHYIVAGGTALFNAVIAPVANALSGLEGPLVAALNTAFQILTFAAVTVLNTIGNFFGLGSIGSTIQSFFTAVGNFLVNGVGAILGQILNAGNFIVNGVTVLVATGGFYWTRITMFLTAIGNLISIVGLVLNDLLLLGGFSGNIALFMDWCWGMFKVYDEGTEGFHRWLDFNENVILKIGKVTYFAADHLFTAILKVKQLLTAWL